MKRRLLALVIIAVFDVVMLAACTVDPETAIVGAWECRDDSEYEHDFFCFLSFSEDGRFVDRDGDGGDWRMFSNTLTLDFDEYAARTFTYEFRGNNLVVITGDEITVPLHRNR